LEALSQSDRVQQIEERRKEIYLPIMCQRKRSISFNWILSFHLSHKSLYVEDEELFVQRRTSLRLQSLDEEICSSPSKTKICSSSSKAKICSSSILNHHARLNSNYSGRSDISESASNQKSHLSEVALKVFLCFQLW
jgi:hypothetical protein